MLRHLDLFSGIGGFSLAASWTGAIETVAFVEIDPFCQKVLKKHWPNTPIISDIREVTGERIRRITSNSTEQGLPESRPTGIGELSEEESKGVHNRPEQQNRWIASDTTGNGRKSFRPESEGQQGESGTCYGRIDILTGGFPCQPFSCAGKRKGTADNRFLWPEMLRVIREVRPRWVIGENVSGLISIDNGMVFEDCCASLEDEGYAVQPFVIPACAVNAPHRRDRVWIVAHNAQLSGYGEHRTSQTVEDSDRTHNGLSQQTDCHAPDTEDTTSSRHGPDGGGILPVTESIRPDNGNFWNEDWYTVALRTCVRDLDDGLPGRLVGRGRVNKLKALGNSIVPQVAYEILKAIIEAEGGN